MFGLPIEEMLILLGYFGIFFLMISNGVVGLPSSQILYILCGYFIFTGEFEWIPVIFIGALGNTIGNIILYEIVRRKGFGVIKKYHLCRSEILSKMQLSFRKRGAWFLFFGKLTPALKVFAPIPPALGKMRRDLYTVVVFIVSIIWTLPFLSLGYVFGKSTNVLGSYTLILLVIALVIVFLFYRYVRGQKI